MHQMSEHEIDRIAAFYKTPLGKLFHRHSSALGRAWVTDCRESASDASMDKDWTLAHERDNEFIEAIIQMEAAFTRMFAAFPKGNEAEHAPGCGCVYHEAEKVILSQCLASRFD